MNIKVNVEEESSLGGEGLGWREGGAGGGERVRYQQHRQIAMYTGRTEALE